MNLKKQYPHLQKDLPGEIYWELIWTKSPEKRKRSYQTKSWGANFLSLPEKTVIRLWAKYHKFGSRLETFLAGALYREFRKFMRILTTSLEKQAEIHHNSGVSAICTNYDGFLWVFPRKGVRIRMNSRNSLYNAPAKKVSKSIAKQNSWK